jgi:hypothetical protein
LRRHLVKSINSKFEPRAPENQKEAKEKAPTPEEESEAATLKTAEDAKAAAGLPSPPEN